MLILEHIPQISFHALVERTLNLLVHMKVLKLLAPRNLALAAGVLLDMGVMSARKL